MTGFLPFGHRVVPRSAMRGLVLESKVPCDTCGGTRALNVHRTDRRKVEVLADLAIFLREGDEWVRVEQGRKLRGDPSKKWKNTAYRASAHVTYLDWFGLVTHRGRRQADWQINKKGLLFLRGELWVPSRILCEGGTVRYESQEQVTVHAVKGVDLNKDYWDSYPWSDFL